jgi:hypothetical protein
VPKYHITAQLPYPLQHGTAPRSLDQSNVTEYRLHLKRRDLKYSKSHFVDLSKFAYSHRPVFRSYVFQSIVNLQYITWFVANGDPDKAKHFPRPES